MEGFGVGIEVMILGRVSVVGGCKGFGLESWGCSWKGCWEMGS